MSGANEHNRALGSLKGARHAGQHRGDNIGIERVFQKIFFIAIDRLAIQRLPRC